METKRPNLFKYAMKYGMIMGALFSVNFLLSTLGNATGNILSYVVIGAISYCTYYFTIIFREKECDGALSYGKGLNYIITLYFFAAIISSAVKLLFFTWVNPEYLPNLLNQSLLLLESMNLPTEEFNMSSQMLDKMMSPAFYAMQTLWINVFIGLFVGLVVATFTKKEKSIFEE